MPICRTLCAPKCVGGTVGVLDGVEGILNEFIHPVHGDDFSVRHSAIHDEEGGCAEVLAHLEVFVVAKAVGADVSPNIGLSFSEVQVADGGFPALGECHGVAFYPASAWESHEGRLDAFEHAHEVWTEPVCAVVEGFLWKEADEV